MKRIALSIFCAGFLANSPLPATAQEQVEQHVKVSYNLDSFVFVNATRGPAPGESGRGYYELVVTPLRQLPVHQNKTYCDDLFDQGSQAIKNKWNEDSVRKGFGFELVSRESCTDLNNDNIPELILWGKSTGYSSGKKLPFILRKIEGMENPIEMMGANGSMDTTGPWRMSQITQHIRLLSNTTGGWQDIVFLNLIDGEQVDIRPTHFWADQNRYVSSKFTYNSDTDIVFSTANKKLADPYFNSSSVKGDIILNRVGSLAGYIHSEGQMNTGWQIDFIASIDLKSKRFRHLSVFHHPTFQKVVNRKYPGFLKKASESAESDPVELKVIGFNKRDLIFKAQVSIWRESSNTKFCGYWKFNVDSGQIALVSWNPSASINVEHKGYNVTINE